jgi:Xaa-Pro aminopeptidase
MVMLDMGAVKDGHFCDFDCNFAIGRASDAVRRAHAALYEQTEDALATLRPGMRACDANRILTKGLVRRGAGVWGMGWGSR